MFTKAAVLSLAVGIVAAQSITGASTECNSYIQQLNSESALGSCTKSLLSASSANQDLSSFCGATTSCSEDAVRSALTTFYSKCTPELSGGQNKEVTQLYDVLYALIPFKNALCAKGDDGKLCASAGASSTSIPLANGGSVPAQQVLQSLGSGAPNATTFASTNLLFGFLNPSTPKDILCTPCTRNILTAYFEYEAKNSYAPGFDGSVLLGGQQALYDAIETNCPANFLQGGGLQAAGSLSDGFGFGSDNAASPRTAASGIAAVVISAFMAAAAL